MTTQDSPRLRAEVAVEPADGTWRTRFTLTNDSTETIELLEARMPHVVFRAAELDLSEPPQLRPGERTELTFDATYALREDASEPANPFLIVRLGWRGDEWRAFVQLALAGRDDATPDISIAGVRLHRVGFTTRLV